MSRQRRRRPPLWPRAVLVAALTIAAVLALVLIVRLITGMIGGLSRGGSERDPQFAPTAEAVTRPPEPDEAAAPEALEEDPSLGWVYEAQSPVDKTAEELAREEAGTP